MMLSRIVQRETKCVYSFVHATPALAPLPDGFTYLHLADEDTVRQWFERDDERRLRRFLGFVKAGYVGMLIASDDAWASVGWIAHPLSPPPPHLSQRTIGHGHVWTFGVHTRIEYRGQGFQKAGLTFRVRLARQAIGDDRAAVLTDVAPATTASRRAKLRVGFEPAGVLRTTTVKYAPGRAMRFGRWERDAAHPPLVEDVTNDH